MVSELPSLGARSAGAAGGAAAAVPVDPVTVSVAINNEARAVVVTDLKPCHAMFITPSRQQTQSDGAKTRELERPDHRETHLGDGVNSGYGEGRRVSLVPSSSTTTVAARLPVPDDRGTYATAGTAFPVVTLDRRISLSR